MQKLGGTVCINKSREWNDLALSPTRSTQCASLVSVKSAALPALFPWTTLDRRCCNAVSSPYFVISEGGFAFDIKSQKRQETLKRRRGGDGTSSLSHLSVNPPSGGPSIGQYIGNVSRNIRFLSTHIVPAFQIRVSDLESDCILIFCAAFVSAAVIWSIGHLWLLNNQIFRQICFHSSCLRG